MLSRGEHSCSPGQSERRSVKATQSEHSHSTGIPDFESCSSRNRFRAAVESETRLKYAGRVVGEIPSNVAASPQSDTKYNMCVERSDISCQTKPATQKPALMLSATQGRNLGNIAVFKLSDLPGRLPTVSGEFILALSSVRQARSGADTVPSLLLSRERTVG
jgi:hypothetical protein